MAENLADFHAPAPDGDVVHDVERPDPRPRRHRRADAVRWRPRARWSRWPAWTSCLSTARRESSTVSSRPWRPSWPNEIEPNTVVVIRYEGPKGGPGMREMLAITGAMKGVGRGADCALVTDGRFSGGTHGFCIGHVAPEASTAGRSPWCRRRPDRHRRQHPVHRPAGGRGRAGRARPSTWQPFTPSLHRPACWRSSRAWPQGAEKGAEGDAHDDAVEVTGLEVADARDDHAERGDAESERKCL
jgi:hypothetical protein